MDATVADEDLMLRYRDGDAAAFDLLYARHKNGVYRYVLRLVGGNRGAAEELHQDVWMNLIRARTQYTVQAKFSTYLYRMAHNRVIDHFRRQRDVQLASYAEDPDEDDVVNQLADDPVYNPAHQVEVRQQAQRLIALIEQLPAAQREALLLREEGGLSLDEIAEATSVDRETAKSRLRYAVAKLTRGMQDWA